MTSATSNPPTLPSSGFVLTNLQTVDPWSDKTKNEIGVEGGKIAGPPFPNSWPRIAMGGAYCLRGFVNHHTHVAMSFFRGLGHKESDMIESFLLPAEANLTPELMEPLSYSYIFAGIRAGITTFTDHYYLIDGINRAMDRFGVRAYNGECVADLRAAFPGKECWASFEKLLASWNYSHRINPVICPHATDTVSKELLDQLIQYAKSNDLPLHMHLAQTKVERQRIESRYGISPVKWLESMGGLSPKTIGVHCVATDKEDHKILADSGATVAICPASQIIYENLAPLKGIKEAGAKVAIATDCAASNDGCDLLSEARLTYFLEESFQPSELLGAITNPGNALDPRLSGFEEGAFADFNFIYPDLASVPNFDIKRDLLFSYNSRQIDHVMVDGRWVLYDSRLPGLSEDRLTEDYLIACSEIKKRAGLA